MPNRNVLSVQSFANATGGEYGEKLDRRSAIARGRIRFHYISCFLELSKSQLEPFKEELLPTGRNHRIFLSSVGIFRYNVLAFTPEIC